MNHRSKFMSTGRRTLQTADRINMEPLIDLAFALLIIFVIATPLLEQTIPLDLPQESQKSQETREDTHFQTLSINAKGEYFWGSQPVDKVTLEGYLDRLAEDPDPPVINIRGDASIPYQQVITVVDLIKKRNLVKISLDTRVE